MRGHSPRAKWGRSPAGSGRGRADQRGCLCREMPGALEEGWRAAGGFGGTCWGAGHQLACVYEGLGVPQGRPCPPPLGAQPLGQSHDWATPAQPRTLGVSPTSLSHVSERVCRALAAGPLKGSGARGRPDGRWCGICQQLRWIGAA